MLGKKLRNADKLQCFGRESTIRRHVYPFPYVGWALGGRRPDGGALRLGEALTDNTVVQFLDVIADQLTMAGADALTPFIATSPSLSHVRILYPSQPRQ